jgi:hypothetical protein
MMSRRRHGQGSVIGGAFLVLIIISFYSIYVISTRSRVVYDRTLSYQTMKDQDKEEEVLDFVYYLEEEQEELHLYLVNSGSKPSQLIHVLEMDPITNNNVTEKNFVINPGVSMELEEVFTDLELSFDKGSSLGILTEKGNLFTVSFTPKLPLPPSQSNLTDALDDMSDTLGDFVFDYHSFQWANFTEVEVNKSFSYYQPILWRNNWEIPRKYDVIFRINATYLGSPIETPVLSNNSHIVFITGDSSNLRFYYIVSNQGDYENSEIWPYSTTSLQHNRTKAIYFGSKTIGGLDKPQKFNKDIYTGILVLYDQGRDYSQCYPLLGIKII